MRVVVLATLIDYIMFKKMFADGDVIDETTAITSPRASPRASPHGPHSNTPEGAALLGGGMEVRVVCLWDDV